MIDLHRRGAMGFTVAEFLEGLPSDTDGDGESLWSIVPTGRGFGFQGTELAEYVRLCVLRLLESGAVPVRHGSDDAVLEWEEQTQYGSSPDEIANAIVAEWLASGGGDPPWGYLWFVTREVLKTEKRA
jgi:hypothetical protein